MSYQIVIEEDAEQDKNYRSIELAKMRTPKPPAKT